MKGKILAAAASLAALAAMLPQSAEAMSSLDDVWCASATECIAVGAADYDKGSAAQALRWANSDWTLQEVPAPDGSRLSRLSAIACVAANDCVAVGRFYNEGEERIEPLARKWDGNVWQEQSIPMPSGAIEAKLAGVACASASACVAVGQYTGSDEVKKAYAVRWNGSSWSLQTVPVPTGAGASELAGVACVTAADCVAVGNFVNSSEVTKTLATVWNGTAWSIVATPEPAGAELSELNDVSCRPSEACTAVGNYFDSTGDQKTLALRRSTAGTWSIQSTPNPAGALSRVLTAVSCASGTSCTAVGILEQGSKELPMVLGWNGTTWTSQAIDSEALGAHAINLTSVHCVTATSCTASGSVAYARRAARRNLAFAYNGTTWLVTEDGDFKREWDLRQVSSSTSQLNAVSCPSAQKCVAVGGVTDDSSERTSQVGVRTGGLWTLRAGPSPEDAVSSELTSVSCVSSSACWAVGHWYDSDGVQHPFAATGDGDSWSLQEVPLPSSALAGDLLSVTCTSAGTCTAVGSYSSETTAGAPMVASFDGTSWSASTPIAPANSSEAWLSSVSCPSTGSCLAVGTTVDPFGHQKGIAAELKSGSWSPLAMPTLEGNAAYMLRGAACPTMSACVVVGGYEDQQGGDQTLAFTWTGSAWQPMSVPSEDETEGLSSVACPSAGNCFAAAERSPASSQPPLLLKLSGGTWVEQSAEHPGGIEGMDVRALSCSTIGSCDAVGLATYGDFEPRSFMLTYSGSWFTLEARGNGGDLRGVSCPVADVCVAVGDSMEPPGDSATVWALGDTGWTPSGLPVPANAYLTDASCSGETSCVVVGRKGGWPFAPLAVRLEGETWTTQSLPSPTGRSANLESVSCPTAGWCVAAGFSWSVGAGPAVPLMETWNGSAWQIASVPLPSAAKSSFLHDVACLSANFCMAVGSFVDASGASHGLMERWNGTSWTAESIPPAPTHNLRFLGVDCTSPAACTTVGTRTDANGARRAVASRWHGMSWTGQAIPLAPGASENGLTDVDCYSSTRCVAVGSYDHGSTQYPQAVGWLNGEWSVETTPETIGEGHATLRSIACFSAADCTAVGVAQQAGALRQPIAFQTKSDPDHEDPPPVPVSARMPRLTITQEEEAISLLEEEPVFQAAIGTADYDIAAIGPWTETNEETGAQTVVGVYIAISLEKADSWAERTWPLAAYDPEPTGYQGGAYMETDMEASAQGIQVLDMRLDTEIDSSAHIVDGELVELRPSPLNPLGYGGTGEIDIDPGSVEFDASGGAN